MQLEAGVGKRKTKKTIKLICDNWKKSGLTKAEFCRQNNLNSSSLVKWLKKPNIVSDSDSSNGDNISSNKFDSDDIEFFTVIKSNVNASNNNFLEFTSPGGVNFKAYLSEDTIKTFLQDLLK